MTAAGNGDDRYLGARGRRGPSGPPVAEAVSLRLAVTLGGMPLEDAFYVDLGPSEAAASIGELADRLFTSEESARASIRETLDVGVNPDLPEMYDALLDVFDGRRAGRCDLAVLGSDGRSIDLGDRVSDHVGQSATDPFPEPSAPVVHVVLAQTFDPIGYAVRMGYYASEEELMAWLRDTAALYAAELGEVEPPGARMGGEMASTVRRLEAAGLAAMDEAGSSLRVTDRGGRRVRALIEEAESYVDRFDIFADVLLDEDEERVDFGTGRGDDLRVQVWEWEGLDPIRALFLLCLYDGTVVGDAALRWEVVLDRERLAEILAPAVDRRHVGDARLELVVDGGYARLEEAEEERRRKEDRRSISQARALGLSPGPALRSRRRESGRR